ncbi:hypothetical protein [Yersinia alsatica]|uniref:hypothetical protein n=1 Tax=Yersinia alsatica TaxID=2890317 RepID=UPI001643D99B|nr:hypothetical protein [Yersinia alsatica]
MNELKLDFSTDISGKGLGAELRALKLAVCLLAAKIPSDHKPESVVESLRGTKDDHAMALANLIEKLLNEAHSQIEPLAVPVKFPDQQD